MTYKSDIKYITKEKEVKLKSADVSEAIKSKPKKKIKLRLVGLDGNAFALLGAFQKQARKEGWTQEEVSQVINKATAGDYNLLVSTLAEHTESGGI